MSLKRLVKAINATITPPSSLMIRHAIMANQKALLIEMKAIIARMQNRHGDEIMALREEYKDLGLRFQDLARALALVRRSKSKEIQVH